MQQCISIKFFVTYQKSAHNSHFCRFDKEHSCEECDPSLVVTIPNAVLISAVGLIESLPFLNTTLPNIGNPLEGLMNLINNAINGNYKVLKKGFIVRM